MKKCFSNIFIILIFFWAVSFVPAAMAADPAPKGVAGNKAKTVGMETGYLENIILEKLPGKERITLEPATNAGYKVRITKRSKIQIRKLYYIKYPHSKVQGLYYKFRYGKHF